LAASDEVSIVNHGASSSGSGVTTYANKTAIDAVSSPSEGDLAYDLAADQLYIRTTTAWKRVSVGVDESPVVTTEPVTTHALNNDGSTSTVTMVANDPEGFAITYGIAYPTASNALPNQLANATSIAQNTGVFTFDPSTNSSHAGNVNVRLSASDGISTTTRIVALSLVFPANHGSRGIHFIANSSAIDYFNIVGSGGAADFGDQNASVGLSAACSNGTRALRTGGGWVDSIDYITVASLGNAVDFGNISGTLGQHTAVSNGTYGIMAGGKLSNVATTAMEYVTISQQANSVTFGNLSTVKARHGGASNLTYALIAGGVYSGSIDTLTMATASSAVNFGSLSGASTYYLSGTADATRAIWKMGGSSSAIQYNTIASQSGASDYGSSSVATATVARQSCGACSDYTYAVISGGSSSDAMDRLTIQNLSSSTDFGDLTATSNNGCSTSGAAA
jgi:hypothetical protein